MSKPLPPPASSQSYFDVSVLSAGFITLVETLFIKDGNPDIKNVCPSMSFLLRHSLSKKTILFDLGIRKDWRNYPPQVVGTIDAIFPLEIPLDVVDSLRLGGLEPNDINYAIPSHVHWDHVGNPDLFPKTQFIAGEGGKEVLRNGSSRSSEDPLYNTAYFFSDTLPTDRTTYLDDITWKEVGPFPRAYDFFGDGSIYIIDAPGHLPGHINILARTSAEGSWIYLGGDSAGDVRLLTGEKEIGFYTNPITGYTGCMHQDLDAALETIRRMRVVSEDSKVLVLIAHDHVWFNENKDKGVLFPGKIPPKV